jgi:hypothetical protein
MVMAGVGSQIPAAASTVSITPASATNHFIVFTVITESATVWCTGASATNIAWDASPMVTGAAGGSSSFLSTVIKGQVTSASAATTTFTFNGTVPTIRADGQEYSTTAGYSAVTLDVTAAGISSATADYPSVTPGHGGGELYHCYCFDDSGTASAGSTSGYTYQVDTHGNGLAYNASCPNSATFPVWSTSHIYFGNAVLLYEAATAPAAGRSLVVSQALSRSYTY